MKTRNARVKIADLASRISGMATPILARNWKPSAADRNAVRAFLVFLEDRRVLFNPFHLEVGHYVKQSILQIREQCTSAIGGLPDDSPAIPPLRGIRAACHRFLDEPNSRGSRFHQRDFYGPEGPEFFTALGEFRSTVGAHVASLAVLYKIDLEPELASIVPAEDID